MVKENDFYVLGIFNHAAWSKQELLNIIQSNWPHLIEPYTLPNALGLSHYYTEDEAAKLRSAGINVLQQRPDGTVHLGMGGGITMNGKSMAATYQAIKLIHFIETLQGDVLAKFESKRSTMALATDLVINLEWRSDEPIVVTDPPTLELNLTGKLDIPPL